MTRTFNIDVQHSTDTELYAFMEHVKLLAEAGELTMEEKQALVPLLLDIGIQAADRLGETVDKIGVELEAAHARKHQSPQAGCNACDHGFQNRV